MHGFGARRVRVDKMAVFNVHTRSIIDLPYCEIRNVSKFTAASRDSPCTAFLFDVATHKGEGYHFFYKTART